MGPRSNERGNHHSMIISTNFDGRLQWGHVQMNVEMTLEPKKVTSDSQASMGPRSNERGNNLPAHYILWQKRIASMGPRSNERGNGDERAERFVRVSASMGPRSNERGNWLNKKGWMKYGRASMGPRSNERGNRR